MSDLNRQTGETADDRDDQELVTCVLGDIEFGLNINAVQEIVRLPRITPVPRAPSYVEGVANLRGNVLPIINSRARFGMAPAENVENNRVVVVELNGTPTGMIVDAVREVMHVSRKDVEEAPPAVHSMDGRFLRGILKLDSGQRLVMLLDHDAVIELDQSLVQTEATHSQATRVGREGTASAAATDESEQLITFRLGDEEYGISIMDVQEIIRVPHISQVPNAPPGVIGIASLRNRVLPVIDLRTKFGFQARREESDAFCNQVRAFEALLRELVAQLEEAAEAGGPVDRAWLQAHRDFERWQETYTTSDRLVVSLLAPLKEAHREMAEASRRVLARAEARDVEGMRRELQTGVLPAQVRLSVLFEKLYQGVARCEDERCLVVNVGSRSLALRVDAVNQVLQAPRSTVESTPHLVAGQGAGRDQIRGIAKLDQGKRLIMLLAVDKLVSQAELTALGQVEAGAQEVSAAANHAAEEDERQFVSFKVADEEFAVDIMQVQEIIRLERVTKVPHAPDYVEGVVNLRGKVLPVIDLRKRVHLPGRAYNDSTRVVVVDLEGRKTGIIVDAVSEVMRVNRRNIEPAPEIVKSTYGDQFIEGVGKLNKGERMFLLLRASELLDERDLQGKVTATP